MNDLILKDIDALIAAIDAIDATPIGRLDEAMNRISDRASTIRRRRINEIDQDQARRDAERAGVSK